MKIGILETGHVPKELAADSVDYPSMFRTLLQTDDEAHEFTFYKVWAFPLPDSIDVCDAWVITGGQVNAWQYPRQYSPRSPLFSRGTIMQVNKARQFLISGTASVVGHETQHDNPTDQIIESIRNVNCLLEEGQRLLGGQQPTLGESGVLRVYVRHAKDLEQIQLAARQLIPSAMPRLYLNGDVCRIDLLTEVDGIVTCN